MIENISMYTFVSLHSSGATYSILFGSCSILICSYSIPISIKLTPSFKIQIFVVEIICINGFCTIFISLMTLFIPSMTRSIMLSDVKSSVIYSLINLTRLSSRLFVTFVIAFFQTINSGHFDSYPFSSHIHKSFLAI